MDKQTVTIYDVAREAQVSMATVSRVVNGNTNVKPSTRAKVLEVIKRLDYRPNAVARGLASKKTTTVGVLLPDITNNFFNSLALGIDDIASMYKYNIILDNADNKKESQVLSNILAKQVDGVIYMGHQLSDSVREEINRTNTPFVLAGLNDTKNEIPSVNIDYTQAFYEVVIGLLEQGYQHIGFLAAKPYFTNNTDRYNGYVKALEEAGKSVDQDLLFETADSRFKNGEEIASHIKDSKADALVVVGDELAVKVTNFMVDNGVKVPEEFAIVTSNNTALTEIVRPSLTSIEPPLYDIGAVSMRILTKLMHKEEDVENHVTLPHKFVLRDSTKH
ncbi:catabolite control protein A [Aerococcus agrisoli]|uniref:Catabolite control protein A n=1 Tax=Aerococcus agrisoli TaxID=2487350 RepID=A0A3N4GD32_9LACT|nr:catabolite control protein A [Aerococcus agrisoli]RPA60115.1 catabolite control protein A [Aerococcus agrisoli]